MLSKNCKNTSGQSSTNTSGNWSFFQKVDKLINGERDNTYGSRTRMFSVISEMWEAYLGHPVTSVDVCNMMALLKIARSSNNVKYEDNYLDAVGYLAIAHELTEMHRRDRKILEESNQ